MPEIQYRILNASSAYVKDGGVLVYSTCTINKRENEEVVSRFLAEHGEFEIFDFEANVFEAIAGMTFRLLLTPVESSIILILTGLLL